ncbi:Callose synthase 10 [Lathyrus oleraceus]|uniref:Callose synthase 10 n=1 Tax=Pisum sativum TaxID=3888 RepID=A0A9D4Y821_PEA|nr:Callose synthase 10 [Pisum sativum]
MITCYTHQGKPEKARKLLELVPDKLDTACWNAMIVGYAKKEWENEFGNAVFREDGGEECCFLEFSYYSACVNLATLQVGKRLHEFIMKSGYINDWFVSNARIAMYAKCGVTGARARLGEIRSIEMVHKHFESFPEAFVKNLVSPRAKRIPINGPSTQGSQDMNKSYAAMFSTFWNEIIKSLREEDYISNREMDLLSIPSNAGTLRLVQWPLFLLSGKILLAVDLAVDCKDTQADLESRISRDEYMAYAVKECYCNIEKILYSLVDNEGRLWVERIFREINSSISEESLVITLNLKKLLLVMSRLTALTGLLTRNDPALAKGAAKAVYELYDVVTHDLVSSNLRENLDTWNILARARDEGRLFSRIQWPNDPEIKELVKQLHLLLIVKDSAANVPKKSRS